MRNAGTYLVFYLPEFKLKGKSNIEIIALHVLATLHFNIRGRNESELCGIP